MFEGYTLKINSCGISDCPPDWHWETGEAGFRDYDLWAVFRGTGTLCVGSQTFPVGQGTCLLLPPDTPVRGQHSPEHPLFVIHVHFSFLRDHVSAVPYRTVLRYPDDPLFFKKVLHKIVSASYRNQEAEAHAWLTAALHHFFTSPDTGSDCATSLSHQRCIHEICLLVSESAASVPSLSNLADRYGYSAAYLGRLFHRIAGVSFSEYVANARISQAKHLLRASELSVTEIAEQLGYYDTCYFIKQFKKAAGTSPGAYRAGRP